MCSVFYWNIKVCVTIKSYNKYRGLVSSSLYLKLNIHTSRLNLKYAKIKLNREKKVGIEKKSGIQYKCPDNTSTTCMTGSIMTPVAGMMPSEGENCRSP